VSGRGRNEPRWVHMFDRNEQPPLVYANVVDVTAGPYDLVMDFGFRTPEQTKRQSTEYQTVVRVAMSLSHAKTMVPVLAKVIAAYEQQAGTIPAPGYEEASEE
jgi:hypothetical protein